MHIRHHFLADLPVTRHARETESYLSRNFTGVDKNNMGVFLLISKVEKRVQSVIYIQDAHKTERTTFEEEKRKNLTEQESDCFRTIRMFVE